MRGAAVAFLVVTACDAPPVELVVVDSSVEDVVDTNPPEDSAPYVYPDASQKLSDGAVCKGHDEDGDGWPDDCDNCPNVANPFMTGSGTGIGTLCQPSDAFAAATRRVLFDPFLRFSSKWVATAGSGAYSVTPEKPDVLSGGEAFNRLRFAIANVGAANRTIVATTAITREIGIGTGYTGIMLRASADGRTFYGCGIAQAGRQLLLVESPVGGCTDVDTCVPHLMKQLPLPEEIPKLADYFPRGVRFSAKDTPDGGLLECRVWDPKSVATLAGDAARFAITLTVPKQDWVTSGEVGLFEYGVFSDFASIDVLVSP